VQKNWLIAVDVVALLDAGETSESRINITFIGFYSELTISFFSYTRRKLLLCRAFKGNNFYGAFVHELAGND
jgi:hypothetical protein